MRSLLAVPATNARFVEKAAQSAADAVFLDLEDAVVPELKEQARAQAVRALADVAWGRRVVAVRVNGLDTPWGVDDLRALAASPRLDLVILPKCDTADDALDADSLMRGHERARLAPLIESAKGVVNAESIAAAGKRLAALIFGPGDYQLDMGMGEAGDCSHAQARIANAARAFGLAPIDGPYFAISDAEGLRAACGRAAALGFQGKMVIHPSQVEVANEVFLPSAQQLAWAREVLDAMAAAAATGRGAARTKDGKMIDIVHIKIARSLLERAAPIATRGDKQ